MNKSNKLIFFSYKSALIFFVAVALLNIFVHPLLLNIGISPAAALYLINGFGVSGVLTAIIIFIEKRWSKVKEGFILFAILFVFATVVFWIAFR